MRSHISLFTLIVLMSLATVGFTQDIAGSDVDLSNNVTDSTSFPYFAEITGNDVYIRSGAGTAFYHCGKLYKGDKVTVVGQKFGIWSQIVPPAGSFSWISKDYVRISPEDPSIGIVTGDNVRVYSGSDYVLPENSTTSQGKLNKNDRVKLLGEELNNFYKIAVPSLPDAYLWVSTQYTKPISPAVDTGPETNESTPAMNTVTEPNSTDNGVSAEAPTETPLDKFYKLQNQLDEERAKPMDQQDFTGIKEGLSEIVNDENAEKAKSYAEAVLDQIEGYELAQEVGKAVILQNEQLEKAQERIEKAYENRKESAPDLGKYAVIGKLKNFLTYGPGHYLIVDDSGNTICYAKPGEKASGKDLSSFIDKKVGLVGTIEPHVQTAGAMVLFDDIEILN